MRRAAIAQRILAFATTPDRAAAVVGDLLEEEKSPQRRWFWPTVARTALAFAWLDFVRFVSGRHPVFSAGADIMEEIMDVWRFVWSRKRLIVIPVVLFTVITSLVAYSRPVLYRSDVAILVVPQRVPESYVRSTVTTRIEDRLQAMTAQILSRTRLEQVINEFDLYAKERKTGIMQDVVERMKRDIRAEVLRGDAFRISYTGENPRIVMKVTERLAMLFIDANLRDRSRMADGTSQFLEGQVQDLARKVDQFAGRMERAQTTKSLPARSEVIEYEETEKMYRAALAKREDAKTAANLETRQIGEQFKVLEAARVPVRPEGLNPLNVGLSGAAAGLGVGLLLMLAAAMRRPPAAPVVAPSV